jgi:hypothetical protein
MRNVDPVLVGPAAAARLGRSEGLLNHLRRKGILETEPEMAPTPIKGVYGYQYRQSKLDAVKRALETEGALRGGGAVDAVQGGQLWILDRGQDGKVTLVDLVAEGWRGEVCYLNTCAQKLGVTDALLTKNATLLGVRRDRKGGRLVEVQRVKDFLEARTPAELPKGFLSASGLCELVGATKVSKQIEVGQCADAWAKQGVLPKQMVYVSRPGKVRVRGQRELRPVSKTIELDVFHARKFEALWSAALDLDVEHARKLIGPSGVDPATLREEMGRRGVVGHRLQRILKIAGARCHCQGPGRPWRYLLEDSSATKETRKKPARDKHAQWKQWKAEGLSYSEIQKRWKRETKQVVTRDAVIQALRRLRTGP